MGRGRSALVRVVPVDDIPPLPDLERLWEAVHDATGPEEQKQLEDDLEAPSTTCPNTGRHCTSRIAIASEELIARYRDHPLDCLSALPV